VKYILCLLKCTDGFQVFNGMVLYGMYKINLNKTSHLNTELKKMNGTPTNFNVLLKAVIITRFTSRK